MSVETPPSTVAEPPAEHHCPRCGAAMTERQEWCLSCGAAVGTRVVAAPGWRTPFVIAGVIMALAVIALGVAIVQLADDTDRVVDDQPLAATATPAPAPATPTVTPDPAALPEASGQETPTPAAGDAEWPAGRAGWTVVLASDTDESGARAKADGFAAEGIARVGVLDSDDFSSLKGGLWIVFAGRYDSQSKARDALDRIDAEDAYIRRIEPA